MNPRKILFLCAANVWRSQMAEWYYNALTKTEHATSAALLEDRRNKYNHKPTQEIQNTMMQDRVDISSHSIQLLNRELCEQADIIVIFLELDDVSSEFRIESIDAVKFLKQFYSEKLIYYPIADPYEANEEYMLFIRNRIKAFIKTLL